MIAVIFEVEPADAAAYLSLAGELRPLLDEIDGFISIERFASLTAPGKLVSLSFWRDQQAVAVWRNAEPHRCAQVQGRAHVLGDYRLRVAEVVRDYGMHQRAQAPADLRALHG